MTEFKNTQELEKHFSQGCGINISKDRVLVNVYNDDDTITKRVFSIRADGSLTDSKKSEPKKQEGCKSCGSKGECTVDCKCSRCVEIKEDKPKKKNFWK